MRRKTKKATAILPTIIKSKLSVLIPYKYSLNKKTEPQATPVVNATNPGL